VYDFLIYVPYASILRDISWDWIGLAVLTTAEVCFLGDSMPILTIIAAHIYYEKKSA
jgi:Zn-dependent protease